LLQLLPDRTPHFCFLTRAHGCRIYGYDVPSLLRASLSKLLFAGGIFFRLVTMAVLHRVGGYDRLADGEEGVKGGAAMGVREFVGLHAGKVGGRWS
jgi:hypothetical protein